MNSLFKNKGPFDINLIIKKLEFVKKKKFKKKKINNISNLNDAKKNEITFFDNVKYLDLLKKTKASFCLIKENFVKYLNNDCLAIISEAPLLDFILLAKMFYPESDTDNYDFKQNAKYKNLNKNNVFIDSNVKIGKKFNIGFNSVIKKNVHIGNNVNIGSNCVISNSVIHDNVKINDGTVIGKIGFGFKYIKGQIVFIPHVGCVKINNNVYIGSNCTIDRGSFSNTVIGNNSFLDNQVHIAHNVKIGSNCVIAGQVGIAGSTNIGNQCMIGGQSGISGHLDIGNKVSIGGNSGVIKNVKDYKKIMGYPAVEIRNFLRGNKIND